METHVTRIRLPNRTRQRQRKSIADALSRIELNMNEDSSGLRKLVDKKNLKLIRYTKKLQEISDKERQERLIKQLHDKDNRHLGVPAMTKE